jgi:hypothetical protein
MIKAKLIELVQTKLTGGGLNTDAIKKYPTRVVAEYIGLAMNTLLYDVFKANPNSLDMYAKEYEVDVKKGETAWYAVLPKSPMQFPNNDYGIQYVRLKGDYSSLLFLPLTAVANAPLYRLGTVIRNGIIPYNFSAGKLFFGGQSMVDMPKVTVGLVLPFSEFDDNDDIMIPLGTGTNLIDTIVHLIQSTKMQDKSDNNNSDT